jgi:hypothetical protein
MNKICVTLVLLLFSFWGFSQNLVPDPIFSDTIGCPDSQNDFDLLRQWFRPNFASSDLYCSCFPTDNPPFSILENKKALKGDCFI